MAEPMQLREPFVDPEGGRWFIQPHLKATPPGTVEGWVRFVGEDGRIFTTGPLVFAETREEAQGWEAALTLERIRTAFSAARFEGAFSSSVLPRPTRLATVPVLG